MGTGVFSIKCNLCSYNRNGYCDSAFDCHRHWKDWNEKNRPNRDTRYDRHLTEPEYDLPENVRKSLEGRD